MTRRITFRFVLYFLGFYTVIVMLTIAILIYALFISFSNLNLYGDIREIEDDTIDLYLEEKLDGYSFSNELIELADHKQAVLQVINENGEVISSSSDDHSLPTTYSYDELVQTIDNPAQTSWSLANGQLLLYTEYTKSDMLLEKWGQSEQFPLLTEREKGLVEEHHAIFDVYDTNGEIIATTNEDKVLEKSEIMNHHTNSLYAEEVKAYQALDDGRFVLVRTPNEHYKSWDAANKGVLFNLLKAAAIFHILLIIIIIIFSLLIGRKFGRPILHILRKIQRLAAHDYSDEEEGKTTVLKNGKMKRKYKVFEDVNKSLARLTSNLQSNERKIAQTEQLREDWITGLSHDLKTPLSTVLGYASMLASAHDWTDEERKRFAHTIEEKATYMDELINDLTYTYQLKNQGVTLERKQTDLYSFMKVYLNKNEYENVFLRNTKESVHAEIDTKRFPRVLDNLIGNALTHNRRDTIVHIQIHEGAGEAIIEITDNGQGMDEETIENLFNRYYRGTSTTATETGTGLGLSIAKQLIEAHGGSIHVNSGDQGTTVTIKLPS